MAGSELWEAAMSHAAPREVRVRVKGRGRDYSRGWGYSRGGMNEGIIQIHTHGHTHIQGEDQLLLRWLRARKLK